jgi:hypothetical protein
MALEITSANSFMGTISSPHQHIQDNYFGRKFPILTSYKFLYAHESDLWSHSNGICDTFSRPVG